MGLKDSIQGPLLYRRFQACQALYHHGLLLGYLSQNVSQEGQVITSLSLHLTVSNET